MVCPKSLYANQNDRIIADLEVRSSLEYESLDQSATTFIQTGNTELGDAPNTFVIHCTETQDKNFRHSRHTVAFYMTDFVGNITMQGSALESVSTRVDWYDINVQGDVEQPSILQYSIQWHRSFNFVINTNWLRVKFDKTSELVDKVLSRN